MSQPLEDKLLALEPHIGTKVTDVDRRRFPRQLLDRKFDSLMLQSNGATLFGLRRIGKSTEAGACCERLRAAGWYVVEEDAQGKTSVGEL